MSKFLIRHYNTMKFRIALLFVISLLLSIITASIPLLAKYLIDMYTINSGKDDRVLITVIFTSILFVILSGTYPLLENNIINNSNFRLRNQLVNKLKKKKVTDIQNNKDKILQVITQDIPYCQSFLTSYIFNIVIQVLTFIYIVIVLISLNKELGLLLLTSIPIYITIFLLFSKKIEKVNSEFLSARDILTGIISNITANSMVLKHIKEEEHTYYDDFRRNIRTIFFWFRKKGYIDASIRFLFIGLQVTIFIFVLNYGNSLVSLEQISIGSYIAFVMFVFNFFGPIEKIVSLMLGLKTAIVSIKRVYSIYSLENEYNVKNSDNVFSEGLVSVSNYHSPYNDNIQGYKYSFDLIPNKINYLIGSNGSGKTTFVNILNRYIGKSDNNVKIDSIDIEEFPLKYIRESIITLYQIPQSPTEDVKIFINNINQRSGNYIIRDFINRNIERFEGKERFSKLSGGEKQLLCFLDALTRKPKILVIDEAFSNLDSNTLNACLDLLQNIAANITILIISHDMSQLEAREINVINI